MAGAIEDPSFGLKGIHVLNDILKYTYLGLLVMCFLLSMGNRPQGAKWQYTIAIIGFGIITIYMTVRLTACYRYGCFWYLFDFWQPLVRCFLPGYQGNPEREDR